MDFAVASHPYVEEDHEAQAQGPQVQGQPRLQAQRGPLSQLALIEADLADLGESIGAASSLPFIASADGALGIAWALAGSSLGNRAMLADLRKRGGAALSTRFLGDGAMPAFFASLRPRLEQPIDEAAIAAAVAGAHAVFARFAEVAAAHLTAEAA